MPLALELGSIRDPAVRRAFEILAQQFPVAVTGGGGGGGGAPSGPAGGVLGGAYPDPGFAVDMATQAELDTHTTATTGAHGGIVASTDPRLTDARAPTGHHATHEPGGTDAMAVDAVAATGSLRTLGPGAQQAASGTDTRLTNARTPTAHAATHQPGGTDAMAVDAAAATGSLRTLGTTATSAAAGNRGQPAGGTAGQALIKNTATDYDASWTTLGTGGPPSGTAGGHLAGTYPNPTLAARDYWMLRLTANTAAIGVGGTLAIPWTQEDADPFNLHAASAATVTVARAGVYVVGFQCYTASPGMSFQLQKNAVAGPGDAGYIGGSAANGVVMYAANVLVTAAVGNTFQVLVTNSSAGAQVVVGNTTNYQAAKFYGYWMGP